MSTTVHFLNVGQGNMTLLQLSDRQTFLYDCNVTDENENAVLGYLANQINWGTRIDVFICSHRDSDHMRGVARVHQFFPIRHVWDSGVTGTTPSSDEYREYMELRRSVGFTEVERRERYDYGNTRLRVMNSRNQHLPNNPNAQSIVIKVVHRNAASSVDYDSVILAGDSDAVTWKNIQGNYSDGDLVCTLLLASHHGAITFFDDPSDEKNYFLDHLRAMCPTMTIVSVGDNSHGHPDPKALEFYDKVCTGAPSTGCKVRRTDEDGNMCVVLKDGGGWSLTRNL